MPGQVRKKADLNPEDDQHAKEKQARNGRARCKTNASLEIEASQNAKKYMQHMLQHAKQCKSLL